jgi:hypothetical protein
MQNLKIKILIIAPRSPVKGTDADLPDLCVLRAASRS